MHNNNPAQTLLIALAISATFSPAHAHAQQNTVNVNVRDLLPKTEIFFAPQTGTFIQGSIFEVPVYINTKGSNVNAIQLHLSFDSDILSVVNPSSGSSIISLWVEAPSYDNSRGTATFVGGIPNGIKTSSGLIANITFQAKKPGVAIVKVRDTTQVLLNDGMGGSTLFEANQGRYTVVPTPPGSVNVFSETHAFQDRWYNNKNPVLWWTEDPGVTGFSFILDDKPNTIPDNEVDTNGTMKSYQDQLEGLWYFHIKAMKNGAWGSATHFEVRIDATPPADFRPTVNYLTATIINRALVSFFTTDALSGLDHYEVGVIDKSSAASVSPIFFRTDSPYQIPFDTIANARLIVRAFDRAGNVRDSSIDVSAPFLPFLFVRNHAVAILLSLLTLILTLFIMHYFLGHHIARHARTIWRILTNKKELDRIESKKNQRVTRGQGKLK